MLIAFMSANITDTLHIHSASYKQTSATFWMTSNDNWYFWGLTTAAVDTGGLDSTDLLLPSASVAQLLSVA